LSDVDVDIVPAARLRAFLSECILAMGWSGRDARVVSDHLVLADQSGHPSHGSGMLGTYVDSYEAGDLRPGRAARDEIAAAPFLVVDAAFGLGHVVLLDTVTRGCAMARDHGVAILSVKHAHHVGRVGHYAEEAARQGFVSLFWSNVFGRPPLVAPFGGAEARIGTNPHCIGVPRPGGEDLILDFATSRIALGKARVAWTNGAQAPEGCLIDHEGQDTRDASVMFSEPQGSLLPFGDHKGAGVGLMAEVLSSILSGADTIAEDRDRGLIANNTLCLLIDPSRLGATPGTLAPRLDAYLGWVVSARPRAAGRPVRLPGDAERRTRADMGANVHLSRAGLRRTVDAGARVGVRWD
jgi:uncharacterized oxidoreductase